MAVMAAICLRAMVDMLERENGWSRLNQNMIMLSLTHTHTRTLHKSNKRLLFLIFVKSWGSLYNWIYYVWHIFILINEEIFNTLRSHSCWRKFCCNNNIGKEINNSRWCRLNRTFGAWGLSWWLNTLDRCLPVVLAEECQRASPTPADWPFISFCLAPWSGLPPLSALTYSIFFFPWLDCYKLCKLLSDNRTLQELFPCQHCWCCNAVWLQ